MKFHFLSFTRDLEILVFWWWKAAFSASHRTVKIFWHLPLFRLYLRFSMLVVANCEERIWNQTFEIFLAKWELQSSLFWIQFQVIKICSCLFTVVVVFFAIIYSFPDSRRHYGVSTVPNYDRFHRTGWLPSSLYWASYNRTYYHLGGRGLVWYRGWPRR